MGFSLAWLAVKGKEPEAVLVELGLRETGERDELPAESPIAAAMLEGGWYVVVFNGFEQERIDDRVLGRVSAGCEVVVAAAEEHVMFSSAAGWQDGVRGWWIRHDADRGIDHLEAEGRLPDGFDALGRRLLDEQARAGGARADVDYVFDAPLRAATLVTGFAHDETEPPDGFAVLEPAG